MAARIIFFANIREALGVGEVQLELPAGCRVGDLVTLLQQEFGEAAEVLTAENTRVAIDQELIQGDPDISAATEVAFFPPVTGG